MGTRDRNGAAKGVNRRAAIAEIVQTVQHLVRATYRFTRNGNSDSQAAGPQVWALLNLAEADRLTVSELAQRMVLHISTVSTIAEQLEKNGWIERSRHDRDRRVVWLKITPDGRDVAARSAVPPRARLPRGLERLGAQELAETHRSLARIRKIMGLDEAPGDGKSRQA